MNQEEVKPVEETTESKHSDLLLLDLLHPDWKNFFSRYKVDIIGFLGAWFFVVILFGITIILTRIGS